MLQSDGQGHSYKYCDWCGKYCGQGGVDSLFHNFCSERCKRAYDKAHNTVDGGYKSGSIEHKIHKVGNTIESIIGKIICTFFIIAIILAVVAYLFNYYSKI